MIELRHVSKRFGDHVVLNDVSLTIHDGETFAIIGRSGTGKSVLLKHIIGLLRPDTGEVRVDGTALHTLSYNQLRRTRRQFGVLFQGGALFDSMTALENVIFPLQTSGTEARADWHRRAMRCLEVVGLAEAAPKKPAELSGGQQKRVALARAIVLEPRYILYDEPTSGLDPETSGAINQLIVRLGDVISSTNVVISHDMHSVLAIADRVGFLHQGRLHWSGTIEELHRADDPTLLSFVKASEYQIGEAGAAAVRAEAPSS